MCGIIGAIAQTNVSSFLIEGLKRLEYRGYDSAGIATFDAQKQTIERRRVKGKIHVLSHLLNKQPIFGCLGIAHTRWATHGSPSIKNAHPHFSHNEIGVVHNGIIENYLDLQAHLIEQGYSFSSQTDTEVIAHLLHHHYQTSQDMLAAIKQSIKMLHGSYALGIISNHDPKTLYAVRCGSPLIIGFSEHATLIASDLIALSNMTQKSIYLDEGDIAQMKMGKLHIETKTGKIAHRKIHHMKPYKDQWDKGNYRHYMEKEIFEQPQALNNTLHAYVVHSSKKSYPTLQFPNQKLNKITEEKLSGIKRIEFVACGTSYHAALVGRYWLESLAGIPCQVEVASEHRYKTHIVEPSTLLIALSQSGETADTLAALRAAKKLGYASTLAISNAAQSTLVHESDLTLLTHAGTEIGVAATKSFTNQLLALLLLTTKLIALREPHAHKIKALMDALNNLSQLLENTLTLNTKIKELSTQFNHAEHMLFLGRGSMFPIALEGALKLKEVSYIHAEAYPAGELKHGPLALVDKNMPIVVVAPNDELAKKLETNIKEVQTRGGKLYIFIDQEMKWKPLPDTTVIPMPSVPQSIAPIIYTIPLQLLAYHVAVLKGTDVDQPRNLAKSVTVE